MYTEKIDFVICWVDGNDPEWQQEKNKYEPKAENDNRHIRYRDWDNLRYWFRGVEKFAPWVNKIHFVTWGHAPSWLNTDHPKLNIVKHKDYIPEKYLPTFSARPIEINMHRIKGISEQFVFFNDDMFLLKPMKKTDFFINKKPCDIFTFDIGNLKDPVHGNAEFNSIVLINKYFDKKSFIKNNFLKFINYRYGHHLIRSLLLLPWKSFIGFYNPHLPNAFLKSTFEEVWEQETELLEHTSGNKFRSKSDLTQHIFRHWQLASGNFEPRKTLGKLYTIGVNHIEAIKVIKKQKDKMICLNDSESVKEFEQTKLIIKESFNVILNEKSRFEM